MLTTQEVWCKSDQLFLPQCHQVVFLHFIVDIIYFHLAYEVHGLLRCSYKRFVLRQAVPFRTHS